MYSAYFPSGVIADHFSSRKLMSFSLFATGMGGFYFVTIPGQMGLSLLFGYWGITNILLFWAAMIRATREWGGVSWLREEHLDYLMVEED